MDAKLVAKKKAWAKRDLNIDLINNEYYNNGKIMTTAIFEAIELQWRLCKVEIEKIESEN